LGRFDDAPQQSLERHFVGVGNAFGFGLGDEIVEPMGPKRLSER